MSVLITGAAGRVGTMLRERLGAYGWTLRCLDLVAPEHLVGQEMVGQEMVGQESVGQEVVGQELTGDWTVGDMNDPAVLDAAFDSPDDPVTAVVHLGGQPTEAPWPVIRTANIDGTHAVFEAARAHGVRRVVYASSNHAVGATPFRPDLSDDTPVDPDTLYGVSKAFAEALGRYYVQRYGFAVACLRIGSCNDAPTTHRELATWCSPADITGLVDAALRKPDLGFAISWAVSNNRDRWWSLAGMRELGYHPVDDAAVMHPQLVDLAARDDERFVGGEYTTPTYGIDEIDEIAEHTTGERAVHSAHR